MPLTASDRLIVALTERRGRMPMAQLLEGGAKGILVDDGLRVYEYFTGKSGISLYDRYDE